jgi:hypothetical protein
MADWASAEVRTIGTAVAFDDAEPDEDQEEPAGKELPAAAGADNDDDDDKEELDADDGTPGEASYTIRSK